MKATLLNNIKLSNDIIKSQKENIEHFKKQLLELLIKENEININDEFLIRDNKIYVCNIILKDNYNGTCEARYLTKKIKKDGTRGNSWDNSYGYIAKDLIKGES